MNLIENFNRHMNDDRIYSYRRPYFGVNRFGDTLISEGNFHFDGGGYFGNGISLWYRFNGYSHVERHTLGAKKWRIER